METDWKDHIPYFIRISDKVPVTKSDNYARFREAKVHPKHEEIIQLILSGLSNRKIKAQMSVGDSTLKRMRYMLREDGRLKG